MSGDRDDLSRALQVVATLPQDSDKHLVEALVTAMEDFVVIFSEVLKAHESQYKLNGKIVIHLWVVYGPSSVACDCFQNKSSHPGRDSID